MFTLSRVRSIAAICMGIGVCGGTGCEAWIATQFLGNVAETARRTAGETECSGAICEPDQWLRVRVDTASLSPGMPWHGCSQSYRLDFASNDSKNPNRIAGASIDASGSLDLAVVTADGVLHVCDFGAATARAAVEMGALGVAFSNAGDRLAVARRDGETGAHSLEILTPELVTLESYAITLPQRPASERVWGVAVSWSPSDATVAVSTVSVFNRVGRAAEGWQSRCEVVHLAEGDVESYALNAVYFVSEDEVVGIPPECYGEAACPAVMRLEGGEIVSRRPQDGATDVLGSHPPTGVFVTREQDAPVGYELLSGALRTADFGPSIIGNYFNQVAVLLVPIDDALPALRAAGFGPEDVIEPDELGGCP